MKWRAESEALKPQHFEIEYDPTVGFYLYVFKDGVCVADHLQDTLEIALEAALEDYDVPKEAWKQVEQ